MIRIAAVALLLAGCTTPGSAPRTVLVCPSIKEYAPETQAAVRVELAEVRKSYPVTTSFIGDYLALRDAVRACKEKK